MKRKRRDGMDAAKMVSPVSAEAQSIILEQNPDHGGLVSMGFLLGAVLDVDAHR